MSVQIVGIDSEAQPSLISDLLASFSSRVFRRRPAQDITIWAAQQNVRPNVQNGGFSDAPEKDRQSDFNTRPSRMPVGMTFNRQAYFAVMRDEFLIEDEIEPMAAGTPKGAMTSWRERENVARPPAVAYGSMVILQPDDPYITLRKG